MPCSNFFSLIQVTGTDWRRFLQSQLTCDLAHLSNGQGTWGAYCNQKGRMTSLFYCAIKEDCAYLWLPTEITEHTLKKLKKFGHFSKVLIEQTSVAFSLTPKAGEFALIENVLYLNLFKGEEEQTLDTASILQSLAQHKYVWLTTKTQGKFLPQEIELDKHKGVSFQKGCYLGQEVVARIHFLGRLQKALFQISFGSDISVNEGDEIYNEAGKVVGEIANVISFSNEKKGLAVISTKMPFKSLTCHQAEINLQQEKPI